MSFYDAMLHIDSGEPAMLNLVLRNARNYLNALPDEDFQLHIVANGAAAKLFTSEHEELRKTAEPLMRKGVKIKVCANAMRDNNISREALWPGCEVTPAGLVEIVRMQRAGFAYIKP